MKKMHKFVATLTVASLLAANTTSIYASETNVPVHPSETVISLNVDEASGLTEAVNADEASETAEAVNVDEASETAEAVNEDETLAPEESANEDEVLAPEESANEDEAIVPTASADLDEASETEESYTVCVTRMGEKMYYESIAAALADLQDGDSLILGEDCAMARNTYVSQNCTIDLGGHYLTIPDWLNIANDKTVTMKNGEIGSNSASVFTMNQGGANNTSTLIVEDAIIHAENKNIYYAQGGNVIFGEGVIGYGRTLHSSNSFNNPSFVVTGGTYHLSVGLVEGVKTDFTMELKGGSYSVTEDELLPYLAEDYGLTECEDGYYTVYELHYPAYIDHMGEKSHYESLTEALAAVQDGDTIILGEDGVMENNAAISESCTIDLMDHNLTISNWLNIANDKTVTMKNGEISSKAASVFTMNQGGANNTSTLIVEDAIIHAENKNIYYAQGGNVIFGEGVIGYGRTLLSSNSFNNPSFVVNGGTYHLSVGLVEGVKTDFTMELKGGSYSVTEEALRPYVAAGYDISKCEQDGYYDVVLHEHAYNQEVVSDEYLATEATCTAKATYYKSCKCGEKGTETFEAGEVKEHVHDQEVVSDEYLATEATCTAKATYYKSCECGHKGTETFESGEALGHDFSDNAETCRRDGCDEKNEDYVPPVVSKFLYGDTITVTLDKHCFGHKSTIVNNPLNVEGAKYVTYYSSNLKVAAATIISDSVVAYHKGVTTITAVYYQNGKWMKDSYKLIVK